MADLAQEQDQQVKKLKRILEGWRMALLPLKSVLVWEEQWHPCAIVGTVSILYLLIWLMDLNTLTAVAVVGLLFNFVDFIVPIITNSIYGPSAWTGQKEKTFEDICRSIVTTTNKIYVHIANFYSLRETSPIMYYLVSIASLLTLAWMSSSFNNIFLLYMLSLLVLLWPGIQQRGIFNTAMAMFSKSAKQLKAQ